MATVWQIHPLFFFSTVLINLPFLVSSSNFATTLRTLSHKCAKLSSENVLYCGSSPLNCEKEDHSHSCQFIITVQKFDFNCPKKDLTNRYIRILCAKRASTYLVSLIRLVNPDPSLRSCKHQATTSGASCLMREFVGVSFSGSGGGTLEDEDVFYICSADTPHITTWTKKGSQRIDKFFSPEILREDPYQSSVLGKSGIGIYWENISPVKPSWTSFSCDFVLSVEESDLEYNKTEGEVSTIVKMRIPPDQPLHVKMIQGFVERTDEDFTVLKRVLMESEGGGGRDGGDGRDNVPAAFGDEEEQNPSFKIAEMSQPLKLDELKSAKPPINITQLDLEKKERERMRVEYWDPLYKDCRNAHSYLCYVWDMDNECLREEKEECAVIFNLQLINNSSSLRIRMIVENYSWGGLSFSKYRAMENNVGYYCQELPGSQSNGGLTVLYNHRHSTGDPDKIDGRIRKETQVVHSLGQSGDIKLFCEWIIPTKGATHEFETEHFVLLAVGGLLNGKVAYHSKTISMDKKFSKKLYKSYTNANANAGRLVPSPSFSMGCLWVTLGLILPHLE